MVNLKMVRDTVLAAKRELILGDQIQETVTGWIPTGNTILDCRLRGGLPLGRIVEIFGNPSQGKTSLGYKMMAGCQQAKGIPVLVDAEGTYDPERATDSGVDTKKVIIIPPGPLEEQAEAVRATIEAIRVQDKKCPILIMWDTIAASLPKAEMEGEAYEGGMAATARYVKTFLRKVTSMVYRYKVSLVFINQVIKNIGVMFGPDTTTPTGGGLKFWASVRLQVTHKARYTLRKNPGEEPLPVGIVSEVYVAKSKIYEPFRKSRIIILFEGAVSEEHTLFDYLYTNKIISPFTGQQVIQLGANGQYKIETPSGDQMVCYPRDLVDAIKGAGILPYLQEATKLAFTARGD